jgi:hypothetical protein
LRQHGPVAADPVGEIVLGEGREYDAGIIQLRSAPQRAPNNAEARFLLGKSLLETGSPSAAETKIQSA